MSSVRTHLVALVVLTLAPVLAFSVWLVFRLHAQERTTLERGLEETAEALSIAVDGEVQRAVTTLQTLATSESLGDDDLERFRVQTETVVTAHGGLTYVVLAGPDGRPIVSVHVPPGEPPSMLTRPDLVKRVLDSGRPVVGNVIEIPGIGGVIDVEVPVIRDDRATAVLVAGLAPAAIGRVIAQHTFPPAWAAAIHDGAGRIIARSDGGAALGDLGPPAMRAATATHGVARFAAADRAGVYAGFARSPLSSWVVTVGVPAPAVDAPLRRSLQLVAAVGGVVILIALAVAYVIGRQIADPLVALATGAPDVVKGQRIGRFGWSAREVRDLATSLETAAKEREQAKRSAEEADLLLRTVFREAVEGIFVKDLAGRYVMINEAGARLIGEPVEKILNRDDAALFAPESAAHIVAQDREVIASGVARSFENLALANAAGVARTYLSTKTPYRDASGRIVGIIGITRDISERKRIEEAHEAARAAAEAANRSKDQFLAMLSHELRTPLNAVLGWVGMMRTGDLGADTTRRAIDAIDRNGHALAQLVSDLLDVSRIVSGKLRLDVRATELAPVIEAAVEALRPAADAKAIRIHAVLDPRAGPVLGDADRLQQIVWNIVANAIKFTPRGGLVQVSLRRVTSQVEILVSDTGSGIDAALLPHVFEAFRQGDSSSTRAYGGLGLGLALVKNLTELHGGTVRAHSLGAAKGATFTVRLPMIVHVERPAGAGASSALDGTPPRLSGVRILVVDDDADSVELLATLLRHQAADVRTARSAAAALAIVPEWRPHVVLADIEMPGEDGYALAERLRAMPPERGGSIPAVAVTAHGGIDDRVRIASAGFDFHLAKPVDAAELIAVVANLTRRR